MSLLSLNASHLYTKANRTYKLLIIQISDPLCTKVAVAQIRTTSEFSDITSKVFTIAKFVILKLQLTLHTKSAYIFGLSVHEIVDLVSQQLIITDQLTLNSCSLFSLTTLSQSSEHSRWWLTPMDIVSSSESKHSFPSLSGNIFLHDFLMVINHLYYSRRSFIQIVWDLEQAIFPDFRYPSSKTAQ